MAGHRHTELTRIRLLVLADKVVTYCDNLADNATYVTAAQLDTGWIHWVCGR
jgi:hypothetical protein